MKLRSRLREGQERLNRPQNLAFAREDFWFRWAALGASSGADRLSAAHPTAGENESKMNITSQVMCEPVPAHFGQG